MQLFFPVVYILFTFLPKTMQTLHIANTFFEWELTTSAKVSLYQAFHQHPVFLQLQFLPMFYADPPDFIFVSDSPPKSYEELIRECGLDPIRILFDQSKLPPDLKIESWGASHLIAQWAQERGILYEMPDWDVVKEVNSKVFSFLHSPSLPGAALLHNEREAKNWMLTLPGDKVLKSAFGVSGRGHLHIKKGDVSWEAVWRFLRGEWVHKRAVIAEPWVQRILDFSTQWVIEKTGEIVYIGSTICKNDERGCYRSTRAGNETELFGKDLHFLEEHQTHARHILLRISQSGYFGHVGCDAMVYRQERSVDQILHPLVEINARKTMGWAALQFQRKYFPLQCMEWNYQTGTQGLLPSHLLAKDKKMNLSRNLNLQLISVRVKK
jgi:hypothetical protein